LQRRKQPSRGNTSINGLLSKKKLGFGFWISAQRSNTIVQESNQSASEQERGKHSIYCVRNEANQRKSVPFWSSEEAGLQVGRITKNPPETPFLGSEQGGTLDPLGVRASDQLHSTPLERKKEKRKKKEGEEIQNSLMTH
jgi:hypothetical protein